MREAGLASAGDSATVAVAAACAGNGLRRVRSGRLGVKTCSLNQAYHPPASRRRLGSRQPNAASSHKLTAA
jgi:hypothetical protein